MEALKHLAPRLIVILTAVWLLIGSANAFAAGIPVSITGADPQAPKPGDTVKFTAKANSNQQLTYYWNFDYEGNHNGFQQAGANVSHRYDARGTYTVIVYVTDGSNGGYATRKLLVGSPPDGSFTIDPTSPVTGQQVTFTNTSTSPDGGQIKTSEWTIDGQPGGTQPTATTTFTTEGEHTVSLRVTDELGYAATHQETFAVAAPSSAAQPQQTSGGGFDTTQTAPPAPTLPNPTTRLAQLNPKPFVRIKGHTTGHGAQIDLFTVRAVGGTKIAVRCIGRKCPVK